MVSSDYFSTDYLARLTLRRLEELNRTRAKMEALEAGVLADYEIERKKFEILSRLQQQYASLAPPPGRSSVLLADLRAHLQAVYDADLSSDRVLRELALHHAVSFAVRVVDELSAPSRYALEGSAGVLALAASSLSMFSQRAAAAPIFAAARAVPAMIKVLSPMYAPLVVIHIANAAGNLADDVDFRISFRSLGGVGAIVRLLRADCEGSVQATAAATLALLSARDSVVQDSVRYLGGIERLVELLAAPDTYTAETARYALLSLRNGNSRNQEEAVRAVKTSPALARDFRRLDLAAELLRSPEDTSPALKELAFDILTSPATRKYDALVRPRTANIRTSYVSPRHESPNSYSSPRSPVAKALDFGTPHSSVYSPPSTGRYSPPQSIFSASPKARSSGAPEVDELVRRKHLVRYSHSELLLLLAELGLDALDLRSFRVHETSGVDLLDMSEEEMLVRMLLPRSKVRKLRALQQAVALFDRIATLPRQGRLSEVEVRLFLGSHQCAPEDVDKIIRLLRNLVQTDRLDFITFWDFVTGYEWIAQALHIYHVPV